MRSPHTQNSTARGKKGKRGVLENDGVVQVVPDTVRHLQPGAEGVAAHTNDMKSKKRKQVGSNSEQDALTAGQVDGELPMEERLTNLTINTPSASVPTSNNLANLLSQGLHSKDVRILQSVLCRWDETVISTTVKSLPIQLIVPLLHEIRGMMAGKAQQNHSLLKWLKHIFQIHSAYLMECPSCEEVCGPFMSLLRSRESLYPKMCQLKGKLELIKGNIQAKEFKAEQPNEALLVYQDESSDEDQEEDAFLPSESEGFLESDDDLGVDDDVHSSSDDEDDDQDDSDSDSSNDTTVNKTTRSKENNHDNVDGSSDDFMDADD